MIMKNKKEAKIISLPQSTSRSALGDLLEELYDIEKLLEEAYRKEKIKKRKSK